LQTVVIDGVDRANQSLEPMGWVLAWEGCIPAGRMTHLLESGFFPKFHAALHAYLSTPGVDLEEVTRWYLEWKQAFSEDLLAHERVRRQINMALDAMNRATTGDGNLGPSPAEQAHAAHTAAKAAKEAERRRVAEAEAERRGRKNDDFDADMSLREAVEAFAEANDLAFMPKPGRTHEGLQVYSFGKVSVVVDSAGEMLRASIGDRWAPVSLDQLLEAHKAKLRAKSKAF
jgi:tuftelin-interacting protein 11